MPTALREPLAATWARACSGLHGHLDWLDAQCSPLSCELERLYDWAALYAVNRLLAVAAKGSVLATGLADAQLYAGSLLRAPNGKDYVVLATVTLGAGDTPVAIRCTTSGSFGNLNVGTVLTLIDPIAGINSTLIVDALGISGGADDEPVTAWRARCALEWSLVVAGGARSGKPEDYRYWARSAHPSISDAKVLPQALGMGTVLILPICNGLVNRLPTPSILDSVRTRLLQIAPAVSDWRVAVPVLHPVALSIHLQPTVDTVANRNAIAAALTTLLLSKGGDANLTLAWAEIDATLALVTSQYVLDESGVVRWRDNELPILAPINWV